MPNHKSTHLRVCFFSRTYRAPFLLRLSSVSVAQRVITVTKHDTTYQTGLTLDAIDLRIEPGQLVGVVGPVGSSKSSLLMAVLREIAPERLAGMDAAVESMGAAGADGEVRVWVAGKPRCEGYRAVGRG